MRPLNDYYVYQEEDPQIIWYFYFTALSCQKTDSHIELATLNFVTLLFLYVITITYIAY